MGFVGLLFSRTIVGAFILYSLKAQFFSCTSSYRIKVQETINVYVKVKDKDRQDADKQVIKLKSPYLCFPSYIWQTHGHNGIHITCTAI